MEKAIVQLERKHVKLMNEKNQLITKHYETHSEHEKCTNTKAALQNPVIIFLLKNISQ